jgi:hypothetical protein
VEVELKQRLGRYVVKNYEEETVRAFVPPPLPPDPPLRLDGLQQLLEQANQAVGRLDGLASILPDLSLFIYTYIRKEAVLSSQIEGTQSSLSDLLMFENDEVPGVPIQDVQEVSNYVAAMNHGLHRLRSGFPLSLTPPAAGVPSAWGNQATYCRHAGSFPPRDSWRFNGACNSGPAFIV